MHRLLHLPTAPAHPRHATLEELRGRQTVF